MKKNRITYYFLLIVCMVTIFSGFEKKPQVTVETETISKKSDIYDIQMNIPRISGLKDIKFQDKINSRVLNESKDFAAQVEKEAAEYAKTLSGIKFVVKQDFKTTHNGENLLSIPISRYYYAGGAHGITTMKTLNIDKDNSKEISLRDLFKEGYDFKSIINKEISSQIEKEKGEYFPGSFKGINDNTEYFLTDEGVIIYYQIYEIAPYVKGFPQFKIRYELLKEGLNYKLP